MPRPAARSCGSTSPATPCPPRTPSSAATAWSTSRSPTYGRRWPTSRRSGARYLIATTFVDRTYNLDAPTGCLADAQPAGSAVRVQPAPLLSHRRAVHRLGRPVPRQASGGLAGGVAAAGRLTAPTRRPASNRQPDQRLPESSAAYDGVRARRPLTRHTRGGPAGCSAPVIVATLLALTVLASGAGRRPDARDRRGRRARAGRGVLRRPRQGRCRGAHRAVHRRRRPARLVRRMAARTRSGRRRDRWRRRSRRRASAPSPSTRCG